MKHLLSARPETSSYPPLSLAATNLITEFSRAAIEQSIIDRFELIVDKYAERPAIRAKNDELTYKALNQAANRLAHAILTQRQTETIPIALLLEHDASTIVALLGVLKAGRAYVALDPTQPQARLTYILEDLQTPLLITSSKRLALAQALAQDASQLINLDELDLTLPTRNPNVIHSPDALAGIFYTSGSTGQPKGVMRDHRHILHRTWLETNDYRIGAEDNISLLYACSFGASVADIFNALLNGATLCLYDIKQAGLTSLTDWLLHEEITLFHLPTALLHQYLDTLTGEEYFPKLRQITPTGRLYKQDVEQLKKHIPPDALIIQRLSSTEAGIVSRFIIDRQTVIPGNIAPVGYAVADKEILLLDEAGNPVNFNQIGEIAVRSRYFAPGYWRRPDLTEMAFQPDPDNSEARIYRMGDLGRMQADGCLEYLGRKDFQIKIRGYRVEIGEIEATLHKLESVKAAAVVVSESQPGDSEAALKPNKRLVAYVVPAKSAPTTSSLRAALAKELPDYMIPTIFVMLDKLPLTANGKLDRKALPDPSPTRSNLAQLFTPPRTALEENLARLWAEVLAIEQVGIRDNFFELGGHSILALRLLSQLEKLTGRKMAMSTLLQAPTVEQFVKLLRQEAPASTTSLIPMRTEGSKPPFFCLPGNLGNVFTDLSHLTRYLGPEQPIYGLQDSVDNPAKIEALAAHYLAEIQAVQPQGPYLLGGICSGGIIAFEMAQQLQAKGERVALLAMIESPSPHGSGPRTYLNFGKMIVYRWLRRLRHHLSNLTQLKRSEQKSYIRLKKKLMANSWAVRRYAPRPYAEPIHLFLTQETLQTVHHPRLNWRNFTTASAEIHEIPGTHDSITGGNDVKIEAAYMQLLAEKLRGCIDKVIENI